jgi:hypothetical protein
MLNMVATPMAVAALTSALTSSWPKALFTPLSARGVCLDLQNRVDWDVEEHDATKERDVLHGSGRDRWNNASGEAENGSGSESTHDDQMSFKTSRCE